MSTLHVSKKTDGGVLPQLRPIEAASADTPRAGSKRVAADGHSLRKTGVQHDRGETSGRSPAVGGVTAAPGISGQPAQGRKALNLVPVLGRDKAPLMPTSPARARKLLKRGQAVVASLVPFVIRMKHITTTDRTASVQDIGLGIDPGSKHTGLAVFVSSGPCSASRKGVFAIRVDHRSDVITRHMKSRAQHRRGRRSRLRYRAPRFLHRTKPRGWLAPSLQHRVDGVMSMVNKLKAWFPVTAIYQELVRFDTQLMENAKISGVEYQQGTLAGFEVREYLLAKYERKCVYCDARAVPLNLDHILAKSKGGSDRVSNLALACVPCNDAKGNRAVEEFVTDPARLARLLAQVKQPLRDATAVNATRWALWRRLQDTGLPVHVGSGGRTKFNRSRNDLSKTHWNDALAVGDVETITSNIGSVLVADQTGRGSYARTRSDRFGFPRLIFPRRKNHFGFITGDTVRAVVPRGKYAGTHLGRVAVRSSGRFAIRTQTGVVPSVCHGYCTSIQRGNGWNLKMVATEYPDGGAPGWSSSGGASTARPIVDGRPC
ncbi:RNA-guided endonuclease IscB [Pseudarthrobacter sp. MDT3-1]